MGWWSKKFKDLTGITEKEQQLKLVEANYQAELKRIEEEKTKLTPKEQATKDQEPYIDIITVEVDNENPSYGSFELDWNEFFVKKLRSMGYPGDTDEVVVDLWFQSVCRNILMETWEQDAANQENVRYINRKDLGNGKIEVS